MRMIFPFLFLSIDEFRWVLFFFLATVFRFVQAKWCGSLRQWSKIRIDEMRNRHAKTLDRNAKWKRNFMIFIDGPAHWNRSVGWRSRIIEFTVQPHQSTAKCVNAVRGEWVSVCNCTLAAGRHRLRHRYTNLLHIVCIIEWYLIHKMLYTFYYDYFSVWSIIGFLRGASIKLYHNNDCVNFDCRQAGQREKKSSHSSRLMAMADEKTVKRRINKVWKKWWIIWMIAHCLRSIKINILKWLCSLWCWFDFLYQNVII